MKMQTLVTALAAATALTLAAPFAVAGEAEDMAGVKAASDAFYSALAQLGDGHEMMAVFASEPYVTMVGPRSKDIITGPDALAAYWKAANKMFLVRDAKITNNQIHVTGNAAWEVGLENTQIVFANGSGGSFEWVATNVYEKQSDGRWLMVSHHVQPGAKPVQKSSDLRLQHPPGGLRNHSASQI